jgi:signal peptidase I
MSTTSDNATRPLTAPRERDQSAGAHPAFRRTAARQSSAARRRFKQSGTLRTIGEAVLLGVIVLMLINTWLVARFTIDSSSMAHTLLGPHVQIACPDCGFHFVAGIEGTASDGRLAICPNCGQAGAQLSKADTTAGNGVLVDKTAFAWRTPHRWEVAAFRTPQAASELSVKRVVGLPGERIELIQGEVYVNGQIVRKTLAERHALSTVVYDDRYRDQAASGPRCWQADPGSRWTTTDAGYDFRPADADGSPRRHGGTERGPNGEGRVKDDDEEMRGVDPRGRAAVSDSSFIISHSSFPLTWLTYHHVRRDPVSGAAGESPIVDVCGYNQTLPVAELHPMRDLALSFQLTAAGQGTLYLKANDGAHDFVVALTADGAVELRQGEDVLAGAASGKPLCAAARSVELSLIDRSCLVAIDGVVLLDYPLASSESNAPGVSQPFAVASDGLSLQLTNVCIRRDVYYGQPLQPEDASSQDTAARLAVVLASDEFYVLADNSPLGLDSRYAEFGPAVSAKLLVGKPFIAQGGSRAWPARWWGIQVPAPCEIRYIR